MASITSLSNSSYNTSSIYGNRNVLSGLASGMDTEQMIENAVSGIKAKIQSLYQKRTKVEWQQEAYRSIIDKAVNFNTKYTSYSSKTNLLSPSFFSNAVNTVTKGTYASKVTASGKTSSDVKLNAVKQLATAATYTVSGLGSSRGLSSDEIPSAVGGKDFDISGKMTVNRASGYLSFQYGGTNGTSFDINFDELEDLDSIEVKNANGTIKTNATNAEKLAQAINNKLKDLSYTYTKNGYQETVTADRAIVAKADSSGNVTFTDGLNNGNQIVIGSSSGNIKKIFGLGDEDGGDKMIKVGNTALANHDMTTYSYLSDKTLGVTFNGTTKNINLSDVMKGAGSNSNEDFVKNLQGELDKAFGAGKIKAGMKDDKLTFTPAKEGDTLSLGGTGLKALGFEMGDSNYINASRKVKDLVPDLFKTSNLIGPVGSVNTSLMIDSAGNKVARHENGSYYRVNSDGKFLYDFKINGSNINLTEDSTLESLMSSINSNAEAGVKVTYSRLTNEFKFTATETGSNGKIEFGGMAESMFGSAGAVKPNDSFAENFGVHLWDDDDKKAITVHFDKIQVGTIQINNKTTMKDFADELNKRLGGSWNASYNEKTGQFTVVDDTGKEQQFTIKDSDDFEYEREIQPVANYTAGRDAIMDVEINGKRFENFTRSSNSFDVDGLTINVKGTFNEDGSGIDKDGNAIEPVTFETSTDADKIIDAIRDFVNDYNEMVTEIKNAYSTLPAQKTDGSRYDPLTAEQEEQYTESERKAYEEKAKQGILFGDTTLSSMYSRLLNAIQPGGTDGQTLREIGIGTSYTSGLTTISLDEDKLRNALESDPDKVQNAFTKSQATGSASNGLMYTLQNTMNTYVKTTGEPKGVLITRAGSIKAPTSINNNSLQSQINSIDKQIERYQTKMSKQIDRYTTQFSRLEQLIAEMNSQASAFAGLMGGDSGY